jgi:hypothetical protein
MKFPFSLFGKKPQPAERDLEEPGLEPAPFPVEQAVAQVQAATGLQFAPIPSQQSEIQEAAAVLTVMEHSTPAPPVNAAPAVVAPAAAATVAQAAPVAPPADVIPAAAVAIAPQAAPPVAAEPAVVEAVVGRDEVIAAYRLFLRRDPESDAVIEPRLGMAREKLLSSFIVSPEFLQRGENVNLVLEVAKAVEQRQAVAVTPGVPVMTDADTRAAKRIFWPQPQGPAMHPQAGDSADRALSQLMRSEHFQNNAFNAQLVTALAKQIVERLNPK